MFQNPVSQDVDTVESTDNDVQEWDSFITMASSGTFDRKRLWVWDTRKITAQAVRPLEETSREDDQDDTFMSSESNQEVRQLPNFTRAAEILTAATKLVTTRIDITYNEVIRVNTQPTTQTSSKGRINKVFSSNETYIEPDLKKIRYDLHSFDIAPEFDPLFHKTLVSFDAGSASGLLTGTLSISQSGRLLFDSRCHEPLKICEPCPLLHSKQEVERYKQQGAQILQKASHMFSQNTTIASASLACIQNSLQPISNPTRRKIDLLPNFRQVLRQLQNPLELVPASMDDIDDMDDSVMQVDATFSSQAIDQSFNLANSSMTENLDFNTTTTNITPIIPDNAYQFERELHAMSDFSPQMVDEDMGGQELEEEFQHDEIEDGFQPVESQHESQHETNDFIAQNPAIANVNTSFQNIIADLVDPSDSTSTKMAPTQLNDQHSAFNPTSASTPEMEELLQATLDDSFVGSNSHNDLYEFQTMLAIGAMPALKRNPKVLDIGSSNALKPSSQSRSNDTEKPKRGRKEVVKISFRDQLIDNPKKSRGKPPSQIARHERHHARASAMSTNYDTQKSLYIKPPPVVYNPLKLNILATRPHIRLNNTPATQCLPDSLRASSLPWNALQGSCSIFSEYLPITAIRPEEGAVSSIQVNKQTRTRNAEAPQDISLFFPSQPEDDSSEQTALPHEQEAEFEEDPEVEPENNYDFDEIAVVSPFEVPASNITFNTFEEAPIHEGLPDTQLVAEGGSLKLIDAPTITPFDENFTFSRIPKKFNARSMKENIYKILVPENVKRPYRRQAKQRPSAIARASIVPDSTSSVITGRELDLNASLDTTSSDFVFLVKNLNALESSSTLAYDPESSDLDAAKVADFFYGLLLLANEKNLELRSIEVEADYVSSQNTSKGDLGYNLKNFEIITPSVLDPVDQEDNDDEMVLGSQIHQSKRRRLTTT